MQPLWDWCVHASASIPSGQAPEMLPLHITDGWLADTAMDLHSPHILITSNLAAFACLLTDA